MTSSFFLWGTCPSANDESAISSCLGLRHAALSAKLGTASLILPFALTWQNTDHALPMAAKVLAMTFFFCCGARADPRTMSQRLVLAWVCAMPLDRQSRGLLL